MSKKKAPKRKAKSDDKVLELHLPEDLHDIIKDTPDDAIKMTLESIWGKEPKFDLEAVQIYKKGAYKSSDDPKDPTYAKTCSGG